jgi:hypothetical protein
MENIFFRMRPTLGSLLQSQPRIEPTEVWTRSIWTRVQRSTKWANTNIFFGMRSTLSRLLQSQSRIEPPKGWTRSMWTRVQRSTNWAKWHQHGTGELAQTLVLQMRSQVSRGKLVLPRWPIGRSRFVDFGGHFVFS